MDERVARLATLKEIDLFIRETQELLKQARRRRVELRAAAKNPSSRVEVEAYEAIFALEEILYQKHGKKIAASRTWPMVRKYGIIKTIERLVMKKADSYGYRVLVDMGMKDRCFESIVLRHPDVFDVKAVARARERLREMNAAK